MHLTPEQLTHQGFEVIDRLDHQELVPFVRKHLRHRNGYVVTYYVANVLCFAAVAWLLLEPATVNPMKTGDRLSWLSYGIALALALVPLHEYIHVLAYRRMGATHTSYDVNLKRFYFMAIADRFVADRRAFRFVALAPFVLISALLLVSWPFLGPAWHLALAGTLLAHTAMCSGDFGLLSYFAAQRDREVVTYDDRAQGVTYFLAR